MAKRNAPKLIKIDNNRPIDQDSDPDFIFLLVHALLLTLEEQGRLDPVQLRQALDKLRLQKWDWYRKHHTDI